MTERPDSIETIMCRAFREYRRAKGWSQESFAREMNERMGMGWTRDTVAAIERGARQFGFSELVAVSWVMGKNLIDFFPTAEDAWHPNMTEAENEARERPSQVFIDAGAGATMPMDCFRDWLCGDDGFPFNAVETEELAALRQACGEDDLQDIQTRYARLKDLWPNQDPWGLSAAEMARVLVAEQKAAVRLGVQPWVVVAAAFGLWGRGLTDERERRLQAAKSHRQAGSPRSEQAIRGHVTRDLLTQIEARLSEYRSAIAAAGGLLPASQPRAEVESQAS